MTQGATSWKLFSEMGLTGVCALLALLTAAKPDWIEAVFGVDPDNHSGEAEWLVVAALAAVAVLARIEWRRLRAS